MHKEKKILGLVPARGGSKGLPRKNIARVLEKPLIAWTIEEALKSAYIDKVAVSTDDQEIVSIASQYGAEVPFVRPVQLATDTAEMVDVVLHAADFFKARGEEYDIVALLQPTSPLRKVIDIDSSIEMLFDKNAAAIVSVCEAEHHPYKTNVLPANLCMKDFIRREIKSFNRQNYPVFYRLSGVTYTAYIDYIRKNRSFFGAETFAQIVPIERSIDIDRAIDLAVAEAIMRAHL